MAAGFHSQQMTSCDSNRLALEVIARCRKLAQFSEDQSSTRRTFLCRAMHDCHRELMMWLRAAGATPAIDAVGNLRALYPGVQPDAPRLVLGSHLDTVPNAGAYDGVLGVVLAVILVEALKGKKLPFAIEVIGFCDEEGIRFRMPFIGSLAMVGELGEEQMELRDAQGISLRQAIRDFGLDPEQIPEVELQEDTLGYIEFHIEQGPVLEKLNRPLAVVEAITGQSRLEFTFIGRANHAGTTPMHLRQDALAGAAEWIGCVEHLAGNVHGLVATVGDVQVRPGAVNVIADEVRATLDVRHRSDGTRMNAVEDLCWHAGEIAQRRNLALKQTILLHQKAVELSPRLCDEIEQAIRKVGCESHRMVSGAGHDAMIVAKKVPAGMVFLRTPGGISHRPEERVEVADVAKAIDCGLHLLHQLAVSGLLSKYTPVATR
jgi:allantoate deiminase